VVYEKRSWYGSIVRCLILAAALVAGCGDSGTPVATGSPSVGGGVNGGPGADDEMSFCTQERDPLGLFCTETPPPMELRAADEAARREFPELENAMLYMALSSRNGALNPDGRDWNWSLNYHLPDLSKPPQSELRFVSVGSYESGILASIERSNPDLECGPGDPIEPLDSRAAMHDAVTRFESLIPGVQLGDGNNLYLDQWSSCIDEPGLPARNLVRFARAGGTSVFAYYEDDGEFVKIDGPCTSTSGLRCD